MIRRRLACSFCGRGEAQVAKLVAGPRVYICDRCAAIAVRIMDVASGDAPRPTPPAGGVVRRLLSGVAARIVTRRRGRMERSASAFVTS